ncbi:hypothetical protein F5Y03DRAFT_409276 [Xylaria venustula]|nr:hypothetical protein F5Y03DRAFT_409276 [Xylaria venustula]
MEYDSRDTYRSSPSPCPHSYEEGVPVCWDCNEEGHVSSPSIGTIDNGPSPSWQRLRRFRKSLGFWDMNPRRSSVYPFAAQSSTQPSTQCSTLELRLPEEGLEVATPNSRRSQPGLIVVAGPRVVSPDDKFIKPEPIRWDSETKLLQSDDVAPPPPPPPPPHDTPEPEPEDTRIWGLRRRTFQIIIVLTILAFLGVIVGIAVGVTQRKGAHSTSLSKQPVIGPVSSSSLSMPSMITETVSLYVTSHSSTFLTLLKTEIPSLSSHTTKPTTTTGTAGSRGDTDPETSIVATVFVTQLPPSPTDTVRSQPTTTASSAPSPKTTLPVSSPPPAPAASPADVPLASPQESPSDSPAGSSPADNPADSPSSRICLGDDGSTYTDPGTGDKFRIECSVAHQGTDLENLEAYTMESCVSLCAKNSHCKGAIWFNVGPQGTDLNYCWLKSAVGGPVQVNADAQSVVRL